MLVETQSTSTVLAQGRPPDPAAKQTAADDDAISLLACESINLNEPENEVNNDDLPRSGWNSCVGQIVKRFKQSTV